MTHRLSLLIADDIRLQHILNITDRIIQQFEQFRLYQPDNA
jgi:hypothetical protein